MTINKWLSQCKFQNGGDFQLKAVKSLKILCFLNCKAGENFILYIVKQKNCIFIHSSLSLL